VLKNSFDFYTLLIGAEGSKTPVGVWFRGDPVGASAEEARRNTHGKRRAWSGNQQAILIEPNKKRANGSFFYTKFPHVPYYSIKCALLKGSEKDLRSTVKYLYF